VTWGTNALNLGSTVITGGTWNGGTIPTGYGGTGLTTFTAANNALYSTSASALAAGTLPVAAGGTGITTTPANGQIPIGNGTNYTAATLTAGNGISITNASGAITVTGTGATINSQTGAYVLIAGDAGKAISITTGGVTVPNAVMSAGNIVTIYNNSGSSQTITQGTSLTLQWAGQTSSSTGSRTLGLYGMATIIFITASNAVITGSGLT
jgi:hypothetical protein